MKSALTVVLFRLFTIGVFVDGKEELVSVTEGDSVTLKSGVTDVQTDDIEWRFSGRKIATISSDPSEIWVESDGSFGDRLQLDSQTGDLKISNIKTIDSGKYKLKISRTTRSPPEMIFTVDVVSSVVSADDVKSVSVLEGDSVTLHTGLTDIQRYDVIQWRFDHQNSPVAEINRKTGNISIYDGPDERLRDRLQLDHQTGSLNIIDTRTTHSGLYEVEISSTISKHTIHKSFSVTVSDDVESVSVMVGDSVTLHTSLTGTQIIEQILWKFGDHDEIIADLNGPVNKKWSNTSLNNQTGDLIISNIQRNQSGRYKVEINTRRVILHRKYNITMIDEVKSVSVKEGETVTLQTITEIQNDDLILWMFGDIRLAEINKTEQRFFTSDGPDERFRGRLKLDHKTVSLNITDTKTTDSGDYELKISSSRHIINRRIIVTVTATDINTTYIPPGTSSSNNYSAVPDSGLSLAAVAGIVGVIVGVLLGAAAVAAVVIYYRHKISGLKSQSARHWI